jgi:hypothetical protein
MAPDTQAPYRHLGDPDSPLNKLFIQYEGQHPPEPREPLSTTEQGGPEELPAVPVLE